jgi:hypothetical protein
VLNGYRANGFERLVDVDGKLLPLSDAEILSLCASGGQAGYVNLLLKAK